MLGDNLQDHLQGFKGGSGSSPVLLHQLMVHSRLHFRVHSTAYATAATVPSPRFEQLLRQVVFNVCNQHTKIGPASVG
jgi:hypothetical protein